LPIVNPSIADRQSPTDNPNRHSAPGNLQ